MTKRLKDRVAIVTGGGRGLGAAISTRLIAEGARVAVADVNVEAAETVAAALRGHGRALAVQLDVTQEDPKLRDRYGRGSSAAITDAGPDWNDQFLVARRLVEAGVRCVTLGFGGWDYHGFFDPKPGEQSERLDQALSALVQDLHDRGLDKDVSVVVWGDFGRTPRMNKDGGRDHWPQVAFALLAGGGMRTGQVIGSTNRLGEHAKDRPVTFQEVFATLYHCMSINPATTTINDPSGRPQHVIEQPAMRELV